jgi:multiple sugar transport system permease protein
MTKKAGFWVGVVILLSFYVLPIVWVYITGFKSTEDLYKPGNLIFTPTLDNFILIFTTRPVATEFMNSIIIALASTALAMIVALPAAYSFSRWNTGSGHLLFITVSTRMFPAVVAAIPFYFIFKDINLLDTHIAIILLYTYFNMSFATFLLYGFFREIPVELEHAAQVDGYGRGAIFWKIIFPLIAPGAAITAVFCLIFAWNEFLFASLFTRLTARTVPVGLSSFATAVQVLYLPMAAMMCLAILPTLIAAWFMQRYIVRGLTFGAVKG